MSRKKLSRRQFVAATALTSAAMITAPYVRGAYAAGKLSIGFWDHWVPGANKATTDLVNEWAEKEKVEVSIDYITSNGRKNEITIAAEAQAKAGHDHGLSRAGLAGDDGQARPQRQRRVGDDAQPRDAQLLQHAAKTSRRL